MRLIHFCSAWLLLVFIPRGCHGGNILVLPAEGSHWINMDILLEALHSRGHNITVVRLAKAGSGHTDKMTFLQRVKNVLLQLINLIQHQVVVKLVYQKVCDKYLGSDIDFNQLMLDADIWLMRVDFVFEFPRPTMPNVVYMGGFQCKPAKPLPEHLEEFVQSSGEHGVIIMSLGAFVSELPSDMANGIAATFGKLPQKVIWRYKVSQLWVCPCFFDQFDNLLRLKERGAAKLLTIQTVDKDNNFQDAIQDVLNEPSYRLNMQRLSRLHRDQPMKPLDTALFWIEFVMRHKGAAHLRTKSYRLPWYSYHSVDVVLFLAGAVLLVLFTFVFFIRCLCTKMCISKVKRE
ncbi:hypothetical protein KUCAC02_002073 [Chaenocephalus aceratus]|uniref:Uncharacterized protein n=1 Tax=Chaenocephalus aceratus TaxID=36190 RepID=A0ACB9XTW7_CHAAC|nr:hypothetical protein KUCAC02_002073 [Chaenocephalus aceratus]